MTIVRPTPKITAAWGDAITNAVNDHETRVTALEAAPLFALKTSDETVNNSSALQNDDALFLTVAVNTTYDLELWVLQSSGATPNFKLDFTLPAGATWRGGHFDCNNTQIGIMTTAAVSGVTGTGADAYVMLKALISIGGTAGTVQLRWAQNTANASNTIVRANSRLKLVPL